MTPPRSLAIGGANNEQPSPADQRAELWVWSQRPAESDVPLRAAEYVRWADVLRLLPGEQSSRESVASSAAQVAAAVHNVAATTEEQTAAMEEVSASAIELNNTALEMDSLLTRFKV